MRNIFLGLLMICILLSCNQNSLQEKHQHKRNNIVNVKDRIKEICIDENKVLIGASNRVHLFGDYLLIQDYRSLEKLIYIFDKNTFEYITSTGDFGEGPTEIGRMGSIGTDSINRKFYVIDHAKMKVFSFDIDSVLGNSDYKPNAKLRLNSEQFPVDYEYINDTLCIGRTITPIGVGDYTPYVSKWNMKTGEITPLSKSTLGIVKHKRITCASSSKYRLALELYTYHDLISIFDFDGNLKWNIYGPKWNSREYLETHYFSWGTFCKNNKFIVSYSGGNNNIEKERQAKQLMIFDINGDYIKTLDVDYAIQHFCYDEENNRLIIAFNDDIQFGYLDLNGII